MPWKFRLARRRVVSFASFYSVTRIPGNDSNVPVLSVSRGVARYVSQAVLASQFSGDFFEHFRQVAAPSDKENRATRFERKSFQCLGSCIRLIAEEPPDPVGYRVDHGIALMGRDEGFRQFHLAGVVLAVADQNDRLSSSLLGKLFFAGQVNRIIDGGAAARRQTVDRLPQRFLVFRKILFERDGPIEADRRFSESYPETKPRPLSLRRRPGRRLDSCRSKRRW